VAAVLVVPDPSFPPDPMLPPLSRSGAFEAVMEEESEHAPSINATITAATARVLFIGISRVVEVDEEGETNYPNRVVPASKTSNRRGKYKSSGATCKRGRPGALKHLPKVIPCT
jgi:hypothetical protein